MKRIALACLLSLVVLGVAQVVQPTIRTVLSVDDAVTLVTFGPQFQLRPGNVLEVVLPPGTTMERKWSKRLPWDAARLGWVLPDGARNVTVHFYHHWLREKSASESDFAWDYEILGNLVKPKTNPWPSVYHTYFDYDIPVAPPPLPPPPPPGAASIRFPYSPGIMKQLEAFLAAGGKIPPGAPAPLRKD